ncbi:hypothetical protein UR09_02005 [Candidatus Nitromaritima sp. SCGC AAA799-A02]|nr:hypothetical protein UZ36_03600 [Candidatus Nitromaritima sp. SCGC AAA799-C22]KMP12078.1 hypothetical protein UR09_02005 [Candidatus Nitromaritima sp. SCGC AAA799-A02]
MNSSATAGNRNSDNYGALPGPLLLIFLLFLVFVGSTNAYLPLLDWEITALFGCFSVAFLLINLWEEKERKARGVSFSSATICLFLFYFWSALGYFYSVRLDMTIGFTARYLAGIVFGLGLILYLRDIKQVTGIIRFLVLCAGVIALFGVLQLFAPALKTTSQDAFFTQSIFPNLNYYSFYLLIHLPLSSFLCFQETDKLMKKVWVAIFVFILSAITISGSPGGQLTTLALLLFIAGHLVKIRHEDLKMLMAMIVVSVSIYGILHLTLISGPEITSTDTASGVSMQNRPWAWDHILNRFMYWQGAWKIFTDYWVTGSGPGTFSLLYLYTGFKYSTPNAHSLFFQTISDTGLVGISLLITSIILFYSRVIVILKNKSSQVRELTFFLAVSMAGFLIHGLIEYHLGITIFIGFFTIIFILLDFISRHEALVPESRWIGRAVLVGGAVFIAVNAVLVFQFYSYQNLVLGNIFKNQDSKQVGIDMKRAKFICSRCDFPYLIQGVRFLEDYKQSGDKKLLAQAEHELNEALRLGKYNSHAQVFLGDIRTIQGRLEDAKDFYLRVPANHRMGALADARLKRLEAMGE